MIFIKPIKFIGPSGYLMKSITLSELRLKAKQMIREIEETREEVIITKNGKPVILMQFITDEAFSLKETERGGDKPHGKGYI